MARPSTSSEEPQPRAAQPADRAARDEPCLGREAQLGGAWGHQGKEETYSHRHAGGTGPFVLGKEWVPDQKIVFTANPHWWNAGKVDGNVTGNHHTPSSPKPRALPLLSGEGHGARHQHPGSQGQPQPKVMGNRTVYRAGLPGDEPPGSNIMGKNPPG